MPKFIMLIYIEVLKYKTTLYGLFNGLMDEHGSIGLYPYEYEALIFLDKYYVMNPKHTNLVEPKYRIGNARIY